MSVLDEVRIILYRVNKKGLEIFLINNGKGETWEIPQALLIDTKVLRQIGQDDELIELDPQNQIKGQIVAVEGDWHDIPSVRAVVKADVRIVKNQIKQRIPELEQGTFVAIKEAFKKVMPNEYACLKELKDIVLEKNQTKYI